MPCFPRKFQVIRSEDLTCSKVSDGNIILVTSVILILDDWLRHSINADTLLGELVSNWGEQLGHTMSITIFWEPRVRKFYPISRSSLRSL